MKKILVITFIVGILAWAGSALATPVMFDVNGPTDSYVTLTDMNTGINVFGSIWFGNTSISATLSDLANVPDFTLNDNASHVLDFFTFSVTGTGIGSFDLEANLNFDTPMLDAGATGSGGWGTVRLFGRSLSGGYFYWDDAVQEFTLSDGNIVRISLEDGFAIGCGTDTTVHATVTNLGGGVAPVPEPATLLLLGSGLLGLAGFRRKNK